MSTVVWGILLPAQLALYAVILINGLELTEMFWLRRRRRRHAPLHPGAGQRLPKVSLHLAICNEPPALVIETLDSLAALDYPDYEVLVIDNNTTDPHLWQPVADHCVTLGARFRFFTLGKWPGYKAGALNFALQQTAADAEIAGLADSDYVVRRDWLARQCLSHARAGKPMARCPRRRRSRTARLRWPATPR